MTTTPENEQWFSAFTPPEGVEPNTPDQIRVLEKLASGANATTIEDYSLSKNFFGFVAQKSFDNSGASDAYSASEAVRFGVNQAVALQFYPKQYEGILDYADFGVVEEWLAEMDRTERRVHGMSIRDYLFANEVIIAEAVPDAPTVDADEAEVLEFLRDEENRKILSVFTATEFYVQEFGLPRDEAGLRLLGRM